MSDFETELENELRELRPAAPSSRLATAIAHELRRPALAPAAPRWSRAARWSLWTSWTLTTAAAAAAVVAWWPAGFASKADAAVAPAPAELVTPDDRILPVSTSNVLTDARDEGLVLLDDGRPARQVRLHYVETVHLREAGTQADIAVRRPREEVRYVPVSLY